MFKRILLALTIAFGLAVFALPASDVRAVNLEKKVCSGVEFDLSGGTDCEGGSQRKLNDLITQIVNIFSIIVGIVAVIMIIYGGFRYITSGGDSGNIGTAKNIIIYALIGLVIVALAQVIVRFVLDKVV